MPADDSPAVLVARYLRSSGYEKTLAAFLSESGLVESQIWPPGSPTTNPEDLTIEKVLEEKRLYDLSVKLERVLAVDESVGTEEEFMVPHPSIPTVITQGKDGKSGWVFACIEQVYLGRVGLTELIIACNVAGELCLFDTPPPPTTSPSSLPPSDITMTPTPPLRRFKKLHSAPILAVCVLQKRYILTGSMSGSIAIHSFARSMEYGEDDEVNASGTHELWRTTDHTRFVVKISVWDVGGESSDGREGGWWVATAGYDKVVNVYRVWTLDEAGGDGGAPRIDIKKVGRLEFKTTPEAVGFIAGKPARVVPTTPSGESILVRPAEPTDSAVPTLIVTLRDSTKVHYFALDASGSHTPELHMQHSLTTETISHLTFSPMSIALSPSPATSISTSTFTSPLVAIATDTVPTMKYLLLEPHTGRVLVESFTGAPQTAYSNAVVVWRPAGRGGVWVNGEDGVVRGVEARSGKVVAEVKGHAGKVRTLWAGMVGGREEREVLVTGGLDGRLVVWEVVEDQEVAQRAEF